jgi:ATP-binding cassette subfamily B protein
MVPKCNKKKEKLSIIVISKSEGRKNMKKIEVVKQQDLQDCGACSLSSIIKYYDGYVPLEKIREDTYTTINGTTAYHLIEAAKIYGFDALGVKVKDIFDKNIYLPAIAHLTLKNGLEHFVVIYKVNKNYIWLMDPAQGIVKKALKDFLDLWDNILILLNPLNSKITHYGKKISLTTISLSLIKENKSLFLVLIIFSLFLMILSIIGNFYFQIAISCIQKGNDTTILKIIIILFLGLFLLKVLISYLKNYYLCYINKNLDISIFSRFLTHIFNLPLTFMQNRSTGEITTRIEELNEIKNLLTEFFTNVILNTILIFGTAIVLYMISPKLFFILCLIIFIYLLIGILSSKTIYRHLKENIEVSTNFNASLIETIEMNTSLKNLNLTSRFLAKLESKLIIMLKQSFNFGKLLNIIDFLKNFIYEIGLFTISSYGIYLIYQNNLELLSLITFNSLIIYLFNPIKDLIDLIPKYNYLKASFHKISEFINIPKEEQKGDFKIINNSKIQFNNVNFSYNKLTNILNNFSLEIREGEKVILIGSSGSGKSTVCKLLCRYLENYLGDITINNTSEKDYSLDTIRDNILYVGQEESLFTGTIKDNIICFRNILEEDFNKVIDICNIKSIIANKPNRYNTVINAAKNNLSGGERQRIILARALLKKAKILILDEALSEVDENLERDIISNIMLNFKDVTLIYVSHKNVADKFQKVIEVKKVLC